MSLINREQLEAQYAHAMAQRKHKCNETAITFIHHAMDFALLNRDEMTGEMKRWRKLAKQGNLKINKYNNETFTISDMKKTELNGKVWYCLVIQRYDENGEGQEGNIDPFGLMILGFMITGFMYAFDKAENRDAVYKYVMNGIDEDETDE